MATASPAATATRLSVAGWPHRDTDHRERSARRPTAGWIGFVIGFGLGAAYITSTEVFGDSLAVAAIFLAVVVGAAVTALVVSRRRRDASWAPALAAALLGGGSVVAVVALLGLLTR